MTGPAATGGAGELVAAALGRHPDRIAFMQDDRRLTYGATLELLYRITGALAASGVGPGKGVAILSRNRPEAWLTQVAAWLLGGRNTPLHAAGSLDDHRHICTDGEIHTLVYDPAHYADHVADLASGLDAQVLALGPSPDAPDLLALAEATPATAPPVVARPEEPASFIYTGGTTGYPKGVVRPQRCLLDAVSRMVAPDAWAWPEDARYLAATPLTHASGILVLPTLVQGGTVFVEAGFDPQAWAATVAQHGITAAFVVPTMLYALLDQAGDRLKTLESLEFLFYGAAPTSPARIAEALDRFGRSVLMQGWGQAESTMVGTLMRPSEHDPTVEGRLASCGRPLPGVGFEVQDEDGNSLAAGEVGELCLSGPFVMDGYWKRPDLTDETLRPKAGLRWLRTGDMGFVDDDGWVTIVDRRKDMIITGGFNVFAREVENALATHPAVASAAVFGLPDLRWGEAVTAAVVLRPGVPAPPMEDLAEHVRALKGPVQAPKRVEFVDEIPVTPLGKPDKKALRKRFG